MSRMALLQRCRTSRKSEDYEQRLRKERSADDDERREYGGDDQRDRGDRSPPYLPADQPDQRHQPGAEDGLRQTCDNNEMLDVHDRIDRSEEKGVERRAVGGRSPRKIDG